MSQIELTEKELEILIHLLSEDITKDGHNIEKNDDDLYDEDEMFLLEKLETLLKLSEFESFLGVKNLPKTKYLN
ncbi:MAG: hypothetical protein II816_01635 [Elusimicrobia bacterium]|nr:hypothetical protein [Elusimicrobiota bacterium]